MDVIEEAAEDIRSMRVRGAAAIGRSAAKALGAFARSWDGDLTGLERAAATLVDARPTAVSLPNAVAFVTSRAREAPPSERARALAEAASEFDRRAEAALAELGRHGARLVPEGGTVLTICNSQGALAPLFEAKRAGKAFRVVALETRPWRQGLITVGQLADAGIDASLAVDSAAWQMLKEAALVLTGADSIALNGDVVNKVGTGGLAVLARERDIPLHVCAETFKVDARAKTGDDVQIEEREHAEVVEPDEIPPGVTVRNPVFDVTPRHLVTSYVTDLGILRGDEIARRARETWRIA